ncbi:MAG TPA: hypothetical protein VF846_01475 [Thermoanaerobaculia bacterium]|jgi:capsule polysaccharide export protein KpsC/LpsZ
MLQWLGLIGGSAALGAIAGATLTGWRARVAGAAVPWLTFLAYLLYCEYFLPYTGGGASMWPIAQLFGGTTAAAAGFMAAVGVENVKLRYARKAASKRS